MARADRGGGDRRWRVALRRWPAWLATAGTLAVLGVAALQTWLAWRAHDATVRASMDRYAAYAAKTAADAIRRSVADVAYRALAPVVGARAGGGGVPALPALARYVVAAAQGQPPIERDPRFGVFRVEAGGDDVSVLGVGREADTAMLRTVAAEMSRRHGQFATRPPRTVRTTYRWHDTLLVVLTAWAQDTGGRPLALVGVVTGAASTVGDAAAANHAELPLLPPVAAGLVDAPVRSAAARALNARLVALRVRGPDGAVLYASPNWTRRDLAGSPYRATASTRLDPADPDAPPVAMDVVLLPALAVRLDDAGTRLTRAVLVAVLALATALALATLVAARRQRELSRARERFVAGVSHDLRTPLAQIRMFSEMLATGMTASPAQAERWLGIVHRESIRLGALVENVLGFARGESARGESGGFRVTPRLEDATALVRETVDAFAPIAAGRAATVALDLPPRAPLWADADAVRQLLGNLLDNAVKYGPEGQTVTVRVEARPGMPGRRGAAGGAVLLTVDDEGPGVPPADRARVWQPFTRLAAAGGTADGTTGGTGLGLSLVRDLAARQRGRAWVEDAPGGGARFCVLLPARAPEA